MNILLKAFEHLLFPDQQKENEILYSKNEQIYMNNTLMKRVVPIGVIKNETYDESYFIH